MNPSPAPLRNFAATRAEEVLRAYLETGSYRKAADQLGISEQTIKNTLSLGRRRAGVETNAQWVALLGWRL